MGSKKDFDIKEELKKLPESPGVYLMYNEVDEIIYVGKAVNLKNRVSQYFHHNSDRSNKIQRMIANIVWFEYIPVETELEALILESNLIKEYRPRYNSALRNDENHPYIKVDMKSDYPKLTITTENERSNDFNYYGPFYKSMEMENVLDFVNKYMGLRTCNESSFNKVFDKHPCINYSIGTCMAPCRGNIPKDYYLMQVRKAIDFLMDSNRESVKAELFKKMNSAANNLEFEQASKYKKMLDDLDTICKRMNFHKNKSKENTDLFAIASDGKYAIILLYLIRNRRLSGRDIFYIDLTMWGENEYKADGQILGDFVEEFYQNNPYIPHKVILTDNTGNQKIIEQALSERKGEKVTCKVPRSGEEGRLVSMTKENAKKLLEQKNYE